MSEEPSENSIENESRIQNTIGGFTDEGDLAREEANTVKILNGIISKSHRETIRFFRCGHRATDEVGGRCSVCDTIVCHACFRSCRRCLRGLCNRCQRLRNGEPYCNRCHLFVTFLGDRSRRQHNNNSDDIQQNNNRPNPSQQWFRLFFGE